MKISKIAKLVKDAGCVQLIQVDVYTMYIGVGGAIYATEDLPLISGAEQARAVLDFTKKADGKHRRYGGCRHVKLYRPYVS